MRTTKLIAIGFIGLTATLTGCATSGNAAERANMRLIQSHVADFNNQDVEGLVANMAEEFVWVQVDGAETAVEADSAEALRSGMAGYFKAVPSVRSSLEHIHASGSYVVARERVRWTGGDGQERSQASWSVYEVRDGVIHAVWYFPAEK